MAFYTKIKCHIRMHLAGYNYVTIRCVIEKKIRLIMKVES